MNQELEIEFKNMVTKAEFDTLCDTFSITDFTEQTNYYFETSTFSLRDKGAALRIRFKNQAYTLTLKQPAQTGLLETHQPLTAQEAQQMIAQGGIITGPVATMLNTLQVPHTLSCLGSLTTQRAEKTYKGGILVFDHSFYFDQDDYELEYEVRSENDKQHFLDLLTEYNIPMRPTQNKVQRFFLAKQAKSL